jgi:hypothetical protein
MDGYWSFNGGVVYDYTDNLSVVVRATNLNDDQCSGNDCYLPGFRVPRTFSFGFRFEY